MALGAVALASVAWLAAESFRGAPPRPRKSEAAVAAVASTRPEGPITLEAIEALARDDDLGPALVRARGWRTRLAEADTPPDDPRLARLDEVIDELRDRLRPSPEPDPPEVAEFREQVRVITEALTEASGGGRAEPARLEAARRAGQRADRLLAEHPESLEPRAGPYRLLREQLRAALEAPDVRGQLEPLLAEARRQLDAGRPTEALEALARFRIRSLALNLNGPQRDELGRSYRAVADGPLPLARCRRALAEADAAAREGDWGRRERLVSEARSHLHRAMTHVPESEYEGLLGRIQSAERAGARRSGRGGRVDDLELRRAYEAALATLATKKAVETAWWIESSRGAYQLARRLAAERPAWSRTLAELTLASLLAVAEAPPTAPDSELKQAEAVLSLRELADGLDSWVGLPDYPRLAGALRDRGHALAAALLARAESDLEGGRADSALVAARQAERLADSRLDRKARDLVRRCRDEIEAPGRPPGLP